MSRLPVYIFLLVINVAIAGVTAWLIHGKVRRPLARAAVVACAFILAAIIASLLLT